MKPFTDKQLRLIGAAYVLERLAPLTPYGKEAARAIRPFTRATKAELESELDNVALGAAYKNEPGGPLAKLCGILTRFRDIRGSLKKLGEEKWRILSDVELFEIKSFLLNLGDLKEAYERFSKEVELKGILITPMDAVLGILDPEGTRLRSFYVSEKFKPNYGLDKIRDEKRRLDFELSKAEGAEEYKEIENQRRQMALLEEDAEFNVRVNLTNLLSYYHNDFSSNIEAITRLDLILAKADLARKYGCVRPIITENSLILDHVYSPEVDAVLRGRGGGVTPISLELSPGTAVLTGANMGGKSVALKTLVLNSYLFQCGFLIFAKAAELPVFDNIDFVLEDESSVHSGLSSFGAEMVHINSLMDHAARGFSLIVLDEPARGTNPREGRAIAAGLAACLNALPSISILSTHYDNVAKSEYNCYMAAGLRKDMLDKSQISPDTIATLMDYRLVKVSPFDPVPNDALAICRLLNVNRGLLDVIEEMI